jgi:type II secretory pathway component PulF
MQNESEMQILALNFPTSQRRRFALNLSWLRRGLGEPIRSQTLAFCFERFATLLKTGMPVNEALRKAAPTDDAELAAICAAIEAPLRSGVPLHRALLPWRSRLPEIVLPILEVGEVAGTLDDAAQRLAGAFAQTAALEKRYRSAICDPWLIIAVLTLYSVAMHPQPPLQMTINALQMFGQLALLYLAARLALRGLYRWQGLRYAVDSLKLAAPHMGTVMRNLAAARWGRSFATLYNSGVPISTALEVSSRSALNARYERAMLLAARRTRSGRTLAESLAGAQLLPGQFLQIISTGELSGNLGLALERFAAELESEAYTQATQEFVFIVSVGKLILSIAIVGSALR